MGANSEGWEEAVRGGENAVLVVSTFLVQQEAQATGCHMAKQVSGIRGTIRASEEAHRMQESNMP